MTLVLEAQGIEKVFLNGDEETRVLKGIDLTLDKGELVALLGRRDRASRRCCRSSACCCGPRQDA